MFVSTFFKDCSNYRYLRYISDEIQSNALLHQNKNTDVLLNINNEVIDLQKAIDSLHSKVIYVDVWASWCVPCRKEMQAAKLLRERYFNQPVEFIYLSIDDNKNEWKTAVMNEGLHTVKNNYIFTGFYGSAFKKKFKIATIPRYLLIDKKGNIVDANAFAPGM